VGDRAGDMVPDELDLNKIRRNVYG